MVGTLGTVGTSFCNRPVSRPQGHPASMGTVGTAILVVGVDVPTVPTKKLLSGDSENFRQIGLSPVSPLSPLTTDVSKT